MNGRRVLTVADHLGHIGGTELAQLEILRGLAERGWEVHLRYVSQGDLWPEWAQFCASSRPIRASLPTRKAPVTTTAGAVAAAVSGMRVRPGVTYVHNAGDVPLALAVGTVTRSPVVAHVHLPPPHRQPPWLNALLRRASSVIAPSDDTARRWVDVAGLDRSRVSAVPTGVDPDHFVPRQDDERQAVRDRLGIDGRSRLVLFAGRLERIKGAHILLAAVRRLPDPVAVVLCGAGTDDAFRAELEAAADSGVSFLGRRSDMADLMAAADLVVVPSIWNDPQPLVVGEAMACGTPVVASDIGGLTTSLAGFPEHLFPPGDVDRLVAVLAATVNWRDDDPGLGPRSRDWALAHFSLSRTFDTIDRILTTAQR